MKKIQEIALLLLFIISVSISAQQPPSGEISDQSLLLILWSNDRRIIVKESFVKDIPFFAAPSRDDLPYRYKLLTKDNKVAFSAHFPDPHEIVVDDFSDPHRPHGGKERLKESEFHLKIPYVPEVTEIQFERLNIESGTFVLLGREKIKANN